jgi:hypothetical protein
MQHGLLANSIFSKKTMTVASQTRLASGAYNGAKMSMRAIASVQQV